MMSRSFHKGIGLRDILLTIVFLNFLSCPCFPQQNEYVSPAGTKFLLYTPPGYYSSIQSFPLLLSLHSKGEVGDDLAELTSKNPEQMPSRLIYLNKWPRELPFIVLTPQLKPSSTDPDPQWPAAYIDEVVRYVINNFRVDASRIYLTGISRGGTGAWTYASAYPEKIAAMVPISGRSDISQACPIRNIPVWAFHGDGDNTASVQYSIDMVNAISACQPSGKYKPHLTILNAKAHNGWNEIYNGTDGYRIYEWLLKFKKNDFSNKAPYVSAGSYFRIAIRNGPFYLRGYFFETDGAIHKVIWRQTSGASLTLSNVNSNDLKVSNLKSGIFEFELSVTDNSGTISHDKVSLEIADKAAPPVITNLVLVNGKTNTDIGPLSEDQVIDKRSLGLTEINIRATTSSDALSVRFGVNSDQNTRTVNSTSPLYIKPPSSGPEWKISKGNYLICATPYSKAYGTGIRGTSQCFRITVVDGDEICAAGKITREVWYGVTGKNVSSIPLQSTPSSTSEISVFESPRNIADNYGARIRGYVCPPVTGNYSFYISSDDNSELWLSTDDNPANKIKIAYISGYGSTSFRQWDKYTSQKSSLFPLQANRRYYIEALHKEGVTYDHVSVGWQLPNGTSERPIPGTRLSPFQLVSASSMNEAFESKVIRDFGRDNIELYPNPISNVREVSVKLPDSEGNGSGLAIVSIITVYGERVLYKEFQCGKNCHSLNVKLNESMANGIYLMNVQVGGKVYNKKMLLNN